ncbi:SDR family oxidoreductase [Micromonospora sp. CA-259024]|uniref:SDR family oxidoreductase n=1 Tax=Micromonospora sp. CA-259024 TaxID=3239965 RepID=UPI003D8FEA52
MQISGAVALVTGANRGLGRHFASQLLERGAKVYATARRPELVDIPGAHVLRLDITDPASIAAAADAAPDVTLLVNNAGVDTVTNLVTGDLDAVRREIDTHFWGTLGMIRAFAPRLGGGAILNVLSAMSWFNYGGHTAYGAAKAAEWNLTNGVRLELAPHKTLVTALHLGAADTDMSLDYEGPKVDPAVVVRTALDGLEQDRIEVIADEWSAHVKASLASDPSAFYG